MEDITLELSPYDVGMLFSLIAFGRRYGDSQINDWSGDLRERLRNIIDPPQDQDQA